MKDAIESGAVQAWIDGKPIQHKMPGPLSQWTTVELTDPNFNNPSCFWRPAPEPRLRPWKPEEVPVGALIRGKMFSIEHRWMIVGWNIATLITSNPALGSLHFDTCLHDYEHSTDGGKTWAPCGVMEGEK